MHRIWTRESLKRITLVKSESQENQGNNWNLFQSCALRDMETYSLITVCMESAVQIEMLFGFGLFECSYFKINKKNLVLLQGPGNCCNFQLALRIDFLHMILLRSSCTIKSYDLRLWLLRFFCFVCVNVLQLYLCLMCFIKELLPLNFVKCPRAEWSMHNQNGG